MKSQFTNKMAETGFLNITAGFCFVDDDDASNGNFIENLVYVVHCNLALLSIL